jgi:FixJ family two-component response regulator
MAPARIALLDDEAPVRTALRRLLRLAGYEVLSYASGEEFLAALDNCGTLDCAVLDVHLPGLNGFQVQQRLQSDRRCIPVVFITASEDVAIDRNASEAGGVCLLRKPFSCDDLLASVARALEPGTDAATRNH